MHAYIKRKALLPMAAMVLLFAGGCDKRETAIRTYSAPKDAAPATAPATAPASPGASALLDATAASQNLPLTWTLPAGWKQDPQPRPMRVATVNVDANGKQGELIVTRFRSGRFGSMVENLNRWRQQVGLQPVANESEVTPDKMTVGGAEAKVYDFTGSAGSGGAPAQRNRVVMVETAAGDAWFFRLHGPADLVESQRGAFDSLLQTVKF